MHLQNFDFWFISYLVSEVGLHDCCFAIRPMDQFVAIVEVRLLCEMSYLIVRLVELFDIDLQQKTLIKCSF